MENNPIMTKDNTLSDKILLQKYDNKREYVLKLLPQ